VEKNFWKLFGAVSKKLTLSQKKADKEHGTSNLSLRAQVRTSSLIEKSFWPKKICCWLRGASLMSFFTLRLKE
jgi:hypothetical protein